MINTLLSNTGNGSGGSIWILLGLLVVLVVMWVFSFMRRKKFNEQTVQMLNDLKPGDKIKTYSGIYGTVVSIRETTDGKVITIETGDEKHKSYTSIDANAIYCLDKKEDVVYDKDGNIIEPKSEETNTVEIKDDEIVETTAEEVEIEPIDEDSANKEAEESNKEKSTKKSSSKK